MIVYAESSAVLAWLLGERIAPVVRKTLAGAERVVASALTILECARALRRAEADGRLGAEQAAAARQALNAVAPGWVLLELTGPHLLRAGGSFPSEPVRTLDAIHLAAAMEFRDALQEVTMLSLDDRVRVNAAALGLEVLPA